MASIVGVSPEPRVHAVTGTMAVAVTLAIAMAAPSASVMLLPGGSPAAAVAPLGLLVPLALILRRAHLTHSILQALFFVLFLVAAPIMLSIIYHLEEYSFVELGFASVRLAFTCLYMTTLACLAGRDDAQRIIELSLPLLGVLLLGLFAFAALFSGSWNWGRFNAASMHPNWWGDIFVAATFGVAFLRSRFFRYLLWAILIVAVVLVMSRKSLLSILVIAAFATLYHEGARRLAIISLLTTFFIIPFLIIIDAALTEIDIFMSFFKFIYSDVLLLDNERRGIESGATGRIDNWALGLRLVMDNFLVGVGFARSRTMSVEEMNLLLHNGHLSLAADLGLFMYSIIFLVVAIALIRGIKTGHMIIIGLLVAFWIVQTNFSPRMFNLSVLPMLFWMSVALMWTWPQGERIIHEEPQTGSYKKTERRSRREIARREPIGARWRLKSIDHR